MLSNLKYGVRHLRKNPGLTTIAIATLAIGIGANTAIFSLVNGALLKPLPFDEPERIVYVQEKAPQGLETGPSTMTFLDWQRQNSVFEYMAAAGGGPVALTLTDETVPLNGARVTARYYDILGAKAELGRTFAPDEDRPGKDHVVVLTHRLWKSQFAADPKIIGRQIILDGEPYTVIGVLPGGGYFDRTAGQVCRPLVFTPQMMSRDNHQFTALGRLKRGVTLEQARAQMDTIGAQIAHDFPVTNKGWGVTVYHLQTLLIGKQLRNSLYLLLGAVGMVLLIACANLANLTLAHATAREREIAIRSSLGANRRTLLVQFLTESLLLSLAGGLCGVFLGSVMTNGLKLAMPLNGRSRFLPPSSDVSIDGHVLIFTLLISVFTSLLFGLGPALQATRLDLTSAIKQSGPGTSAGRAGRRLRGTLVIAEIALAFLLLSGAGLLIHSLFNMLQADVGFDSTNVVTAYLPVRGEQSRDPEKLKAYLRQVIASIKSLPGVDSVALTSGLPLRGASHFMFFRIPGEKGVESSNRPVCFFKMISPSYFSTLRIRLWQGRTLTDEDVKGSSPAAVINATMAHKYFPDSNPLGKRIMIQSISADGQKLGPEIPWEVVGVVADEKVDDLSDKRDFPGVYVTSEQSPIPYMALVVRSKIDSSLLRQAIKNSMLKLNKEQLLIDVMTLDQIKSESTGNERFICLLLGLFAGIATLLSVMGIYGVVSYSVVQRTHEIGIRSALGASAGNILGLILRNGMIQAAVGLIVGAAGSIALGRLISSQLFGVSAQDPITMAGVTFLLAFVALVACFIPARRATKVDPVIALRAE